MTQVIERIVNPPVKVHLRPALEMTDDQFFEFCQINRDLRIERNSEGDLLIMPPTGGETGFRNFELTGQFREWVKRDGRGIGFDSSTGFTLPNGAKRSPDLSWVMRSRLAQLTTEQKRKFIPLTPDFVLELRSETDSLDDLQEKMREYLEQGAQLGWLLDPHERRVYIYRPSAEVEHLDQPQKLSGNPELPGLEIDLREIWEANF